MLEILPSRRWRGLVRGDVVRVATATADRVDVDVDGVECMMITVMPM